MSLDRKYFARLMLAGEYAFSAGGEALTVPLKSFYARISLQEPGTDPEKIKKSISELKELFFYLKSLSKTSFHAIPEIQEMENMLEQGYYIKSNIPQSYGLGRSGAISALVYDQYFMDSSTLSFQEQREDLALIESFFHKKSTGLDALSCLVHAPLHFLPDGEILNLNFNPCSLTGGYRFFLLDSGHLSNTIPLVSIFADEMKKNPFQILITEDYIPLVKKFISSITGSVNADPALLFRAISDFQWNNFREMIPDQVEDQWIEGQVSNTYYLKLNGLGGGFMLGITHEDSMEAVEEMMKGFNLIWV